MPPRPIWCWRSSLTALRAVILRLIQREVNGPCSFGLLNANENTIYIWKLSVWFWNLIFEDKESLLWIKPEHWPELNVNTNPFTSLGRLNNSTFPKSCFPSTTKGGQHKDLGKLQEVRILIKVVNKSLIVLKFVKKTCESILKWSLSCTQLKWEDFISNLLSKANTR